LLLLSDTTHFNTIKSDGEDLHRVHCEPTDLGLHPVAVGTQAPHHPADVEPGVQVAVQLSHEEGLPLHHPLQLVPRGEVLVRVEGVSPLEIGVYPFEPPPARLIFETVVEEKVDEDNGGLCPYAVDRSALVLSL
jgi:hypothetical protein